MHRTFADSRIAVIWRRLFVRPGAATPRVTVRTQMPWYWRALAATALLSLVLAAAAWIYDAGRRFARFDRGESAQEIEKLKAYVAELEQGLSDLRAKPESGDSRLQIERTAQQQLVAQVRSLEEENGRLKEELALFENLAATDNKGTGLTINRFRVEPDAVPGQYRYRMLLAFQGGKKDREFKGSLQLLVSLQQEGKSAMIIFPSVNDSERQRFSLSFRYFRRIDGVFQVPAGARVKAVEARLLQDGATKASQSVTL